MKGKGLITVLMAMFILVGCSEKEYKPKPISVETDVCEVCKMSITHADFAGQIVFKNNDHMVFDDLGCLMEYIVDNGEDDIGAAFIVEETSGKWINVKDAVYLYNQDFWTPMSYGVLAFDTEEGAIAYMEENGEGELLQFEDLYSFNWGVHSHE